jgi:hypothetical protein
MDFAWLKEETATQAELKDEIAAKLGNQANDE